MIFIYPGYQLQVNIPALDKDILAGGNQVLGVDPDEVFNSTNVSISLLGNTLSGTHVPDDEAGVQAGGGEVFTIGGELDAVDTCAVAEVLGDLGGSFPDLF